MFQLHDYTNGRSAGGHVLDYPAMLSEIQQVYLADDTPWVIGFSGGKDSTASLQMVFYALSELPQEDLAKQVHVISSDTLVENPAVVGWLNQQLLRIQARGKAGLFAHKPQLFTVRKVTPTLEDTFWVNLIGRGYPSPNRWFRWCTDRMKIKPTSRYIFDEVSAEGRALVVLGTRRQESSNRAKSMSDYEYDSRLRRHAALPNALIYAPIADLTDHEVWAYLLQCPSPWGSDNRALLSLYVNASGSGECPFVVETGTQSCGGSRFGCWVCTVVDRDRSMENLIHNGVEWMEELLSFRDWLYEIRQETAQHVPKGLDSRPKFGPFLLRTRRKILDRLLGMQEDLDVELISPDEIDLVHDLLATESAGEVKQGLREFRLKLGGGRRVHVISDFDLLTAGRKRLGPMHLKHAELLRTQRASSDYGTSTRVLYYLP